MSVFERWLCNHPKTAATCGGLLTFALVLGLCFGVLLAQLYQEIDAHQQRLDGDVRRLADESHEILARLNEGFKPDCSPENLARINTLLFEYSVQRDIGLYDEKDRVFCTSSVGRLSQAITDADTSYRSRDGNKVWVNTPTPASGGKGTMVSRNGRFNLAMAPRALAGLSMRSDVAWIGGDSRPIYVSRAVNENLLARIAALELAGLSGRTILLREGVIVVIRRVEGTRVRFANFSPLIHAWLHNPGLSMLLFGLSLACGTLTAGMLRPRIAERTSLRRLLPLLLVPANIRCRYQPVVELATGRPVGCEVLMRLQHGSEVLDPEHFIGLVQELGLSWQMDRAVMDTALRELRGLNLSHEQFSIAFNLFPDSVSHVQIDTLFNSHPSGWRSPERSVVIGLEVTEYDFSEALIPELRRLREAGYRIAVDDFGTGYSNLNTVKKVAPDLLKIDKSFVFEMEDASARSSLIPEIIGIARAVNAKVVAEGVEQEGQAVQLAGLGVEYGQGYYFARPLPLDEFADYLRKHGAIA